MNGCTGNHEFKHQPFQESREEEDRDVEFVEIYTVKNLTQSFVISSDYRHFMEIRIVWKMMTY